jgi:N,N-dimethylformamidase
MIVPHEYEGQDGTYNYQCRADMTYFDAPNGGAVFSCSSIAFGQALPVNNFENDVSRLLANVVNTFVKPGPLPTAAKSGTDSAKAAMEQARNALQPHWTGANSGAASVEHQPAK